MSKKTSQKKRCDKLWKEIIKKRAGFQCEYCGKRQNLNSHHIYSRSNFAVRWDLDNGICLCISHHTFNINFSAHKTPLEFIEWVKEKRGEEWYQRLKEKANKIWDKNIEKVLNNLIEENKKYEEF